MSNNDWLKKRFSIGCSLAQMSLSDWKRIIDEFHPYIYDVYFSPPIAFDSLHSRSVIRKEFERPNSSTDLFEALRYAKSKGIKLELALNTNFLNDTDRVERMEERLRGIIKYVKSNVELDSCVTLNPMVDIIREELPDIHLVYAYNAMVKTKKDIDNARPEFDEIVMANSVIRNFKLFSYIKSKGKRVRWMPNNGCSFACQVCSGGSLCETTYNDSLKRMTPENIYALQAISPWELHQYYLGHSDIDIVKLSTRPSTYSVLYFTLKSYIFNLNHKELLDDDAFKGKVGIRYLWGRMGQFSQHDKDFDFDRINEYKREIWRKMGK